LRAGVVNRLARDIARSCRKRPLILLHGGGSFGHPLAHRFDLHGKLLSAKNFIGVGLTVASMRNLGSQLAVALLRRSVPVVPLQTGSFVTREHGKLAFSGFAVIESILAGGGIPLLGGDVVIDSGKRSAIASADALAVVIAKRFHARRVLFASDVAGVYERFPPLPGTRPRIRLDRSMARSIGQVKGKRSGFDVTGGMSGKLRSLLPLRNCEVTIFNGLVPGALARALKGRAGTRIRL
jgi:isopentenyl phosphate kinase